MGYSRLSASTQCLVTHFALEADQAIQCGDFAEAQRIIETIYDYLDVLMTDQESSW